MERKRKREATELQEKPRPPKRRRARDAFQVYWGSQTRGVPKAQWDIPEIMKGWTDMTPERKAELLEEARVADMAAWEGGVKYPLRVPTPQQQRAVLPAHLGTNRRAFDFASLNPEDMLKNLPVAKKMVRQEAVSRGEEEVREEAEVDAYHSSGAGGAKKRSLTESFPETVTPSGRSIPVETGDLDYQHFEGAYDARKDAAKLAALETHGATPARDLLSAARSVFKDFMSTVQHEQVPAVKKLRKRTKKAKTKRRLRWGMCVCDKVGRVLVKIHSNLMQAITRAYPRGARDKLLGCEVIAVCVANLGSPFVSVETSSWIAGDVKQSPWKLFPHRLQAPVLE